MRTRLSAVALTLGLAYARAGPVSLTDHKVAVYLHGGLSSSSRVLSYMKEELEGLLQTTGFGVEWKALGTEDENGIIAVIELRGSCRPPEDNVAVKPVESGASLASTAVEGGKILPFSWINCETLTEMLAPSLAGVASEQREFLYGRAMGRVLAHELYHMLANQRGHAGSGVAKASFSAGDMLSERFTFEHSPLAPPATGGGGHRSVAIRP